MSTSLLLWTFVIRVSHPNRPFWYIPRAIAAQPGKEGVDREIPLESRAEERRECEDICDNQDKSHMEDLKWRRSVSKTGATAADGS